MRAGKQLNFLQTKHMGQRPKICHLSGIETRKRKGATISHRRRQIRILFLGNQYWTPFRKSDIFLRKAWPCRELHRGNSGVHLPQEAELPCFYLYNHHMMWGQPPLIGVFLVQSWTKSRMTHEYPTIAYWIQTAVLLHLSSKERESAFGDRSYEKQEPKNLRQAKTLDWHYYYGHAYPRGNLLDPFPRGTLQFHSPHSA